MMEGWNVGMPGKKRKKEKVEKKKGFFVLTHWSTFPIFQYSGFSSVSL